jgi:hypothetical protein
LIWISFVAKSDKHFFMCILATWISFIENCQQAVEHNASPFNSNWIICSLLFSFLNSLNILDINSLCIEQLGKIFTPSVGCLLIW